MFLITRRKRNSDPKRESQDTEPRHRRSTSTPTSTPTPSSRRPANTPSSSTNTPTPRRTEQGTSAPRNTTSQYVKVTPAAATDRVKTPEGSLALNIKSNPNFKGARLYRKGMSNEYIVGNLNSAGYMENTFGSGFLSTEAEFISFEKRLGGGASASDNATDWNENW